MDCPSVRLEVRESWPLWLRTFLFVCVMDEHGKVMVPLRSIVDGVMKATGRNGRSDWERESERTCGLRKINGTILNCWSRLSWNVKLWILKRKQRHFETLICLVATWKVLHGP